MIGRMSQLPTTYMPESTKHTQKPKMQHYGRVVFVDPVYMLWIDLIVNLYFLQIIRKIQLYHNITSNNLLPDYGNKKEGDHLKVLN